MSDEEGLLKNLKKKVKELVPPIAILGVFIKRVLSGWSAYQKMMKECPLEEGWRIWFMDYNGSGDTYLTCGYLQSKGIIGEHDAFVSAQGTVSRIAKLFHFGRYVELQSNTVLNVRAMERFLGHKLKFLPLLYESDLLTYSGIMRKAAGIRDIDFMTMLKIGLESNCSIPYEEGPWKQPEFSYESIDVQEIFEKNGLVPGKTVLFSPYAGKNSMWDIPISIYEKLAQMFIEEGYKVCTNSGDTYKEPAVPGTVLVQIPYRIVREFCECAGYFIGLRSGLCDIISDARCIKIILYDTKMKTDGICSFYKFFSLKNMGLCDDAIEIELKNENLNELF